MAASKDSLRRAIWLGGAFALCFLAGGWSFWKGSYQEYLQSGFHWDTVALLAGAAILLAWFTDIRLILIVVCVGAAFPAIIAVRVVMDGLQDPTDHNLWPFEVGLACAFGMIAALLPASAVRLVRRLTTRRNEG
jgi:hypothetical protein